MKFVAFLFLLFSSFAHADHYACDCATHGPRSPRLGFVGVNSTDSLSAFRSAGPVCTLFYPGSLPGGLCLEIGSMPASSCVEQSLPAYICQPPEASEPLHR